jgi:hypothetical protein
MRRSDLAGGLARATIESGITVEQLERAVPTDYRQRKAEEKRRRKEERAARIAADQEQRRVG